MAKDCLNCGRNADNYDYCAYCYDPKKDEKANEELSEADLEYLRDAPKRRNIRIDVC